MSLSHLSLTAKDMAMLRRVLTKAGFNFSPNAAEAARFLTRKFQEGNRDEPQLALALQNFAAQANWQFAGPPEAHPTRFYPSGDGAAARS